MPEEESIIFFPRRRSGMKLKSRDLSTTKFLVIHSINAFNQQECKNYRGINLLAYDNYIHI